MKERNNSIFLLFTVACFVRLSFATIGQKRSGDEPESSRPFKFGNYQSPDFASSSIQNQDKQDDNDKNSDQEYEMLDMIEFIDRFKLECTADELVKYSQLDDQVATNFIKACDSEAQTWISKKVERIGDYGEMINRWLNGIANQLKETNGNVNKLTKEDWRSDKILAPKVRESWRKRKNTKKGYRYLDKDANESSRNAYYLGDGVCVHILSGPLSTVEGFMKIVLKDFGHLEYVQKFYSIQSKNQYPISLKIYIFQTVCRKFYENQKDDWEKKTYSTGKEEHIIKPFYGMTKIVQDTQTSLLILDGHIKTIEKYEKDNDFRCDWYGVNSRKEEYRLLHLTTDKNNNFGRAREKVDKSIDTLVGTCLERFALEGTNEIYSKIEGTPKKDWLPNLLNLLRGVLESHDLSFEQSINDVLDVRQPGNVFKESLIKEIKSLVNFLRDLYKELAKFYIDLLLGNVGDFNEGIFREPIYKDNLLVEFKTIEFLSHIFSIKGYKPRIKDPLLDFYYLYKIAEYCNMVPVDVIEFFRSSLAMERKRGEFEVNLLSQQSNLEHGQTSLVFLNQNTDQLLDYGAHYKDSINNELDRIEQIVFAEPYCQWEILLKLKHFPRAQANNYFIKCDHEADEWLKKKMKKLGTLNILLNRWFTAIKHSLSKINLDIILNTDMRDEYFLGRNLRNSWYSKESGGIVLDDDALSNARRAFTVGDGICVHLLSPPFDRIEKLMEVVVSDFQQSILEKPMYKYPNVIVSLKIFIFQKFCRRFSDNIRFDKNDGIDELYYRISRTKYFEPRASLTRTAMQIKEHEQKFGYKCVWSEVFSRKQQYNSLHHLQKEKDYPDLKNSADESFDEIVKYCLSQMIFKNGIQLIYERAKNKQYGHLLSSVIEVLSGAISSYQLPDDQSINSALDIRSPSNGFRTHLMKVIRESLSRNPSLELAQTLTNLLLGDFGHSEDGVFSEPIYENMNLVEYKSLEFLLHVFDVQGYHPSSRFSSALIDFYYLYKVSEICDMVSFKETLKLK